MSGDTIIGEGTKIDCQVHLGHGVVVGKNCLFAAQVGVAGKTIIEDGVVLYGQVGIAQSLHIGAGAVVLAKSGVSKSLEAGKTYFGTPADEMRERYKELAALRQLPEFLRKFGKGRRMRMKNDTYKPNATKMRNRLFLLSFVLLCLSCSKLKQKHSDQLQLVQINPRVWVHISFLQTESWGKVGCNGMVYLHKNEAIVFDTPTDSISSVQLIDWVEKQQNARVKAVVINHFHNDCLGGISAFQARGIPSYARDLTIKLAKENGEPVLPSKAFADSLRLDLQGLDVINRFHGEGHTRDNIVSYLPAEQVLFGGCLVKTMDAGKGWLGDANVEAWSETMRAVKRAYPNVRYVIPGHGPHGGKELLDFTEQLFEVKK